MFSELWFRRCVNIMEQNQCLACVNSPKNVCYMCGHFILKSQHRLLTHTVKQVYYLYFGGHMGEKEKSWVPQLCHITCYINLIKWMEGKKNSMSYAIPIIWHKLSSHLKEHYF
jgi:hypothetical protein